MRKTSVYLTTDESEGLRRLAVREGRSQAELIREGVRHLIEADQSKPRTFRSMGAGRSGPRAARPGSHTRWTSEEVYGAAMGRKRSPGREGRGKR